LKGNLQLDVTSETTLKLLLSLEGMASDIILISVSHNTHAVAKNASIPGAGYPLVSSRTIVRDCQVAAAGAGGKLD